MFVRFFHGRYNSHVIKRRNYVVEPGARVDIRNDGTIIMYIGMQCHTLHLIVLSSYVKISKNIDWVEEYIMTFEHVSMCRCIVIRLTLESQLQT